MRKFMVGLSMVVSLLAVTPLAMAQHAPGSLDPVGLIASGAVIPFLGEGLATGGMSFLELYAPVGSANVHMFLFDASCVRGGPSINVDLTANDAALIRVDNIGSGAPTSGLITAAETDGGGFTLFPWTSAFGENVAARTLWANSNGNFVRVIDPIALANIDEVIPSQTIPPPVGGTFTNNVGGWNPMRTAAAFFAPLEAGGLHTTIYFVCPNTNIQRSSPTNGGALSPANGFNIIFPRLQTAGAVTPLRVRVYNDDEHLLRDVTSSCNCLTIKPVTALDLVYASAVEAPFGTYTEVEGGTQAAVPAVCSSTVIEPLVTPGPPGTGPATPNAGNACPGAPLGCLFNTVVTGIQVACTGQFQQTTPAIPGAGPFSFVAYRAITVPGFDVFGRVPGSSLANISGGSFAATLGR
jgi:hypothetical protein